MYIYKNIKKRIKIKKKKKVHEVCIYFVAASHNYWSAYGQCLVNYPRHHYLPSLSQPDTTETPGAIDLTICWPETGNEGDRENTWRQTKSTTPAQHRYDASEHQWVCAVVTHAASVTVTLTPVPCFSRLGWRQQEAVQTYAFLWTSFNWSDTKRIIYIKLHKLTYVCSRSLHIKLFFL